MLAVWQLHSQRMHVHVLRQADEKTPTGLAFAPLLVLLAAMLQASGKLLHCP